MRIFNKQKCLKGLMGANAVLPEWLDTVQDGTTVEFDEKCTIGYDVIDGTAIHIDWTDEVDDCKLDKLLDEQEFIAKDTEMTTYPPQDKPKTTAKRGTPAKRSPQGKKEGK